MMSYPRAGLGLSGLVAAGFHRLRALLTPTGAAPQAWNRPPGNAPPCLRRAMADGNSFTINPATEGRCLSGLTRGEAEEVLDWIEGNGFLLCEVRFHKQSGYVVHWELP